MAAEVTKLNVVVSTARVETCTEVMLITAVAEVAVAVAEASATARVPVWTLAPFWDLVSVAVAVLFPSLTVNVNVALLEELPVFWVKVNTNLVHVTPPLVTPCVVLVRVQ